MPNEPIDVITYAGRKGDERPETFMLRGLRIDVREILERRIEEGCRDRIRRRYYRIRGSDGIRYELFQEESTGAWFLAAQS